MHVFIFSKTFAWKKFLSIKIIERDMIRNLCEGWNFNSGNYLFTTDTK